VCLAAKDFPVPLYLTRKDIHILFCFI
jgi:hypothetical protein